MLNKTKEQWIEEATKNYKARNYTEALIACEHAIQLDATFARAFHGKALILTQQKKYADALEAYNQASQLAPDHAKIHSDIGELFYILKNYEKSYRSYKMAMQLDRKYGQIYNKKLKDLIEKAYHLREQRRYDEAITAFRQALLFDPHNTSARNALLELQNRQSRSKIIYCESWDNSTHPSERRKEAIHNNEWSANSLKVHPFNCRCKDCIEY